MNMNEHEEGEPLQKPFFSFSLLHVGIALLVIVTVASIATYITYYIILPRLSYNTPKKQDISVRMQDQPLQVKTQADNNNTPVPVVKGVILDKNDWTIYTNSLYHFSISYPIQWKTEDLSKQPPNVSMFISPDLTDNNEEFSVTVAVEKTDVSIQEWLKDKIVSGQCCSQDFILTSFTQNGHTYYTVRLSNSIYSGVITSINGTIYYMYNMLGGLSGGASDNESTDPTIKKNLSLYNEMISSFSVF